MIRGLVIAALLLIPACKQEEAAPVAVARAFAAAVARSDVRALTTLVERRAVERLERAAEQASNQVGGRRNIPSAEMLQIVDLDPIFQIGHAELLSMSTDTARVELEAADGTKHVLDLVLEDGSWHVRIPVPGDGPETTAS